MQSDCPNNESLLNIKIYHITCFTYIIHFLYSTFKEKNPKYTSLDFLQNMANIPQVLKVLLKVYLYTFYFISTLHKMLFSPPPFFWRAGNKDFKFISSFVKHQYIMYVSTAICHTI